MSQTPEETRRILEQLGVKSGNWQEMAERLVSLDGVTNQGEHLLKLKAILESIAAADQKRLAALKEQLARVKFGGGA